MYELGELAPSLIGPLMTSALATWNPLASPKQFMDIFIQWKGILDKPNTKRGVLDGNNPQISPYDNLVWNIWIPVIRTTVA